MFRIHSTYAKNFVFLCYSTTFSIYLFDHLTKKRAMSVKENINRYSLPVETMIRQILSEEYPKLNTAVGSAVYDLIITPAAIIQQAMRDRMRVIQRNQSIRNYATMLPEEMDRLAANFFVERRAGTRATGLQRVYFTSLQNIEIPSSAEFSDDSGHVFRPISPVTLSATALAINTIPDTGEYYVDVAIIADQVGEEHRLDEGRITRFSGIQNATRTTNLFRLSGGRYAESNSELYVRIKNSLATRDSVKSASLKSMILDNFDTVTDVIVQGYGDPLMTRDTATVVLSIDKIFPGSFAQKVNLPLDSSGEVAWDNEDGDRITAPLGGYVGAIYDLTGKDFNQLRVSADGVSFDIISVQPGFKVQFLDEDDPDRNTLFVVTRVEEVPIEYGGDNVKVARLDRALSQTTLPDSVGDGSEYTLLGFVNTNTFHIGGKTDVYIKSISDTEKSVIISSLPPTEDSSTSEIPLTPSFVSSTGVSLFENNIGFDSPVMTVVKVEQLDAASDEVVLRTLTPDIHYKVVKSTARGRFTRVDNDVLRIEGVEEITDENGDSTGVSVPMFIGERIKVTYVTNSDINTIQTFVDNDSRRMVAKDIQVLPLNVVLLDVNLSYAGSRLASEISEIVSRYLDRKSPGSSITVNELLTVLAYFGVTDVTMPVRLTAITDNGDGTVTTEQSEDRIELSAIEMFKPVASLSITQK